MKKLFKNQAGFNDVIVMTIIGGILGSLFITGIFVWKEVEVFNTANKVNQLINKTIDVKKENKVVDVKEYDWQVYTNKKAGFSIKYPNNYLFKADDNGLSLEMVYEKPLGTEEMFMGGRASVSISLATDENNSGPYFSESFIEENSSLRGFDYYTWAMDGFSEDMLEILAFYDKEMININGDVFTVFYEASGMDNVIHYFLFKDDVLIHISDNRLGASEQELNEKIISSFKLLEKEDNTETPSKISYGSSAAKEDEYRADCASKGGKFNPCDSACPPGAMCIQSCFFSCDLSK